MNLLYFKALHIIFVVCWFAGLFYMPRLFIYHVEALARPVSERDILVAQFKIMQRRLWYGITWPSCILTALFGASMLHNFFPLTEHSWLMVKLGLVLGLFLYHLWLGYIYKKLRDGKPTLTSDQLRVANEAATLFLFAIVFLAVLKDLAQMGQGFVALIILSILLGLGIKLYRKKRQQ
jgi:putative membrane protein